MSLGDWLSIAGLLISLLAFWQGASARKAVAAVLKRNEDQTAQEDARELHRLLSMAQDAARGHRRGASSSSLAGRYQSRDIRALEMAQDALATTTLGAGIELGEKCRLAAQQITIALDEISAGKGSEGWARALFVIQGIIPDIVILQRSLTAKGLRPG